jgi:LysR family transcriptional regulator, regulator of abg operon
MKLKHLRDVEAIADRGSLRAAARHLRLAQPALTRSVHELERELGVPLFERRARGMVLTPMGQAFLRRSKAILSEVRRARDEVNQLHGGTRGSVVAALSSAPLIGQLPNALRPFRARFPDVQLHLIEGLYPTIETGLRDGSTDLYIGPQPERALPPELRQEKLFDNTRTILARRGHSLAHVRSLRQLTSAEWATTSVTHRAEEELGELFSSHRLPPPRLALQSQSALTLIVCLANSDLLAMVPTQWTRSPVIDGILVEIAVKERLPAPPIVIIRRAGLPLTPAAEALVDLMRQKKRAEKSFN